MKSKWVLLIITVLLLTSILTACSSEAASTPAVSSDNSNTAAIDAKTLVETKCTACHGIDRIAAENFDEAGWAKVVDQMDKKGNIGFSAEEKAAISAYLAETYK